MTTESNPKWVSVKDRMPPLNTYCWLAGFDEEDGSPQVWEGMYSNDLVKNINSPTFTGFRSHCCQLDEIVGVTHWMEYYTPEPPK